jgi:hypothetical protein
VAQSSFIKLPPLAQTTYARLVDLLLTTEAGDPAAGTTAAEAAVLQRLAPVFRVGGVLVGSYAFAVLGNMLGVRWQDAIVRTDDVDIAHDYRIAVDAFATGSDGRLWHAWTNDAGSNWFAWENPLSVSGVIGTPSVVSWSANHLDIFWRSSANRLGHLSFGSAGWGGIDDLGTPPGITIASAPTTAAWGPNRLDTFVRGSDNRLWQHVVERRGVRGLGPAPRQHGRPYLARRRALGRGAPRRNVRRTRRIARVDDVLLAAAQL